MFFVFYDPQLDKNATKSIEWTIVVKTCVTLCFNGKLNGVGAIKRNSADKNLIGIFWYDVMHLGLQIEHIYNPCPPKKRKCQKKKIPPKSPIQFK